MASDRTAPALTSLSLPGTVDVTTGLQTVGFTVGANDVGEGVDRVVVRFDRSFATSATSSASTLTFFDATDSFADGISALSQRFDPASAPGTYNVARVEVFDKVGNMTSYTTAQLSQLNIATSFQIASNTPLDNTAPVLTGLSLPTSVDVRNDGTVLPITVSASDNERGVGSVSITFDRVFNTGSTYTKTVTIRDSQADPFADGSATGAQFFGELTEPGTYTISNVTVTDKAGNAASYATADLTALGIATTLEVTSNTPLDTTAPVLTGFDLPDVVDVTGGNAVLGIFAAATDAGTGVQRVSVRFDQSFRDRSGAISSVTLADATDSLADGAVLEKSLFASSQPGTYAVTGVTVYDADGNSRYYNTAALARLGFDTSFQVADRNLQPTVSVVAPTAIAEDGGSALMLSLQFANGAPATGTVTLSLAAARSTVSNGTDVDVPNFSGTYSVTPAADGTYTLALPSIAIKPDQIVEGTEVLAVTIRASGQVFDTGSDSKTVLVSLIDSGQTGGAGADTLTGTRFGDDLSGLGGNDILKGAAGDDRIDGGAGYDVALFSGLFHQNTVAGSASAGFVVAGPDGRDTVVNVERFQFADGSLIVDPDSVGAQIVRLYDAVLQRQPDNNGLDFYLDRIQDRGGSLLGVANDLIGSAEFSAATGSLSNAQFVDYVYRHTLGREPDAGGKAYYTQQLDQGESRGAMLVDFSESAEHRALTQGVVAKGYFDTDDTYQSVALFYDAFAGRQPDAGGLVYYAERVKAGTLTLTQVAADFAGSTEFRNAIAGKDSGQVVDYIYQNTLHRTPDAGGRAFYKDQLDHGATAAGVLQDVALSAEHYNLYAPHITYGIDVL